VSGTVPARDQEMLCTAAATRPVDGVLAQGATARAGSGRDYHHISPGQQHRDISGQGRLQVTDESLGAGLVYISDLGRVPDQPDGLVAAPGQEALQQERDLPVPARDHRQKRPRRSGPCGDRQRPHGPPRTGRAQKTAGAIIAA